MRIPPKPFSSPKPIQYQTHQATLHYLRSGGGNSMPAVMMDEAARTENINRTENIVYQQKESRDSSFNFMGKCLEYGDSSSCHRLKENKVIIQRGCRRLITRRRLERIKYVMISQ